MKKYDLICAGTALVDSIIKGFDPEPVSASGYRAETGSLNVGGEAVNAAAAASKLGLRTGILCSLGNDAAGDLIEAELRRTGVVTDLVVRDPEHPTPVTTMFVSEDGSRKSITNSAHKYNFHPERYTEALEKTKAVALGSLFRAPFNDPEITYAFIKSAAENGVMIFADTKLPNFRQLTLRDLEKSLPLIDFITPNEDEASFYTGRKDPAEMAEVFLDFGIKNVIIKLGGRGCYFRNKDFSLKLPAYDIKAVDATGAGDNFLAGFICCILSGEDIASSLAFANACGAVCATAVGAGTALKSRFQIKEFMKNSKEER